MLRGAKQCCLVGEVYKGSPARTAGLTCGDIILAFGALQCGRTLADRYGYQPDYSGNNMDDMIMASVYKNVTESIAPLVRNSLGKPIDVVVRRTTAGGGEEHVQLVLTPERWQGSGLLGCVLK